MSKWEWQPSTQPILSSFRGRPPRGYKALVTLVRDEEAMQERACRHRHRRHDTALRCALTLARQYNARPADR